MNEYFIACT